MWTLPRSPVVRVLEFWLLGVVPAALLVGSAIAEAHVPHARVRLRPRLCARDPSRPARLVAVRAVDRGRPRLADGVRLPAARRLSRLTAGGASPALGGHSRHGARSALGAGDSLARRSPGLAVHRSGASVGADRFRDPPRNRQPADGPRCGAHVAVEGPSAAGRNRARARDRTKALPLAARRSGSWSRSDTGRPPSPPRRPSSSCSFPGSRSEGPGSCRIPTG